MEGRSEDAMRHQLGIAVTYLSEGHALFDVSGGVGDDDLLALLDEADELFVARRSSDHPEVAGVLSEEVDRRPDALLDALERILDCSDTGLLFASESEERALEDLGE